VASSRSLVLSSSLVLAAALGAVAGERAESDLAPLLKEARAQASASPDAPSGPVAPEGALWLSFSKADVAALRQAGLVPQVAASENAHGAVYPVSEEDLPKVSAFMHDTFKRCGGFFSYRTKAEADEGLRPFAKASAGPYTLDQQAWVKPLLGGVGEAGIRATIETLSAYNNRFYQSGTGVEAAGWVSGRWGELAKGIPGASASVVTHSGWKQPSAVLTIPGTDLAEEIVVLGGHLDSINGWGGESKRAPGADDNASGIAVLTETLRVLAQSGFRPRRTVQFMGYAAEEVGLRGSQDIAQKYKSQGKKVVGVIQFDMTNFKGSADDIYILGDNVDPTLSAFLGKLVDAYLPGVKRNVVKCGYGCSDHASWTKAGFPASAAFESAFDDMNKKIHTADDTLGNSGGSAAHSVNFAKLGVAFAAELAKASNGALQKRGARLFEPRPFFFTG
jgi:leucyl aminopeptidase